MVELQLAIEPHNACDIVPWPRLDATIPTIGMHSILKEVDDKVTPAEQPSPKPAFYLRSFKHNHQPLQGFKEVRFPPISELIRVE